MQIFAVVPVISATGERSFSTLKIEKTYIRSRMLNDRLNALILINVHKDYKINNVEVAREYLEKPPANLPLIPEQHDDINLADMEDPAEFDPHALDPELHGLDADEWLIAEYVTTETSYFK